MASAQSAKMNNMLKEGANMDLVVPANNFSVALGVDVVYHNLFKPGFGLGIASGYIMHYYGKDNKGYKNNEVGVVPVAA